MVHLIVGLILLAVGAWGIMAWWLDLGAFFRGLLPILFVLAGVAAIGAGSLNRKRTAEQVEDDSQRPIADECLRAEQRRMVG